jgi:hypothetical protein
MTTYTVRWDDGTESVLISPQACEDAAYDRGQRGDVWLTSERYGPGGECIPLFRVDGSE